MKKRKNLVIVGGGYGGTTLVDELKNSDKFSITLINKTPLHIVQTEIHRIFGKNSSEENICINLEKFCQRKGASFLRDTVIQIDDVNNKIICESQKEIDYDYLVIATGALSFFPEQIKNIQSHSQDLKLAKSWYYFEQEFQKIINSEEQNQNIVVVGGGLTGVEVASEYAARLKNLGIAPQKCKVSIVEQLPTLLPGLKQGLIDKTHQAFDTLGIQRYHGNFVTEVRENDIILSDGKVIPFSMLIISIGVTSEKLPFTSPVELSKHNQFLITPTLHVKGFKNIFAIGDVTYLEQNDKMLLPTAQNAKQQAKTLALTLKNLIQGADAVKYVFKNKGTLVDLSAHNAVGDAYGIQVSGKIAYYLKRIVNALHTKMF
jgi:NADH dehydrogenase